MPVFSLLLIFTFKATLKNSSSWLLSTDFLKSQDKRNHTQLLTLQIHSLIPPSKIGIRCKNSFCVCANSGETIPGLKIETGAGTVMRYLYGTQYQSSVTKEEQILSYVTLDREKSLLNQLKDPWQSLTLVLSLSISCGFKLRCFVQKAIGS